MKVRRRNMFSEKAWVKLKLNNETEATFQSS